ncbi:hypothetical protein Chor_008118, partial [Crotalus horridus]
MIVTQQVKKVLQIQLPLPPLLLAIFSSSFLSSHTGAKGCCCPNDWLSRNGFCYKVHDQLKTWKDAEMFCRKHKPGCHLASIHSMAESADLAEYISDYLTKKNNVWIGLNDAQKKRIWEWTDRSCTDYLSWKPGEPNNKLENEFCVELWADLGKPRGRGG